MLLSSGSLQQNTRDNEFPKRRGFFGFLDLEMSFND